MKTKFRHRLFSVTLVLCMLLGTLSVLPVSVFAAGEAKITPSATGGTYDEGTNTLTLVGGGEVSFTPSSGIEFESVEGTKQPKDGEDTTVDDNVSATLDGTKWVATLPNEDAKYIFRGYYYDTNDDYTLTECTVVIKYGLRAPTNLRWDTSNGTVAVWDAVDGATHYKVELYKKDIISLRLISHVISDTSFDFDLTSSLPGSYYFTVRANCDDIKSKTATSDDIIMTTGGTPILFNGSSERVDYIDGTAFVVGRDDIANGSISEVDMTPIIGTTSLTEEQAKEIIDELLASYVLDEEVFKSFVISELADYSLDEIKLIRKNIRNDEIKKGVLIDIIDEEIESREATDLVIAPGYIDSTSYFKVTTGQGLGVTYSNDAIRDLLTTVDTGSNIKVSTKFEKAEITRDEARIIVEGWAEIVNTAEGEEQIKNLLTTYSIYELALLQQYTKILVLDDSTAQKLYELMRVERDKKKEEAATKDNEQPLAAFSVNTYAVAADGTQTYIPVQKSMQYAIPVDTSSIPENATLALYRVNEDGTRTKQEILSVAADCVIAQTDGNSDYVLVYEINEPTEPNGFSTGAIVAIVIASVAVLAGGGFALYWFVFKKKKA